MVVVVVVVEVVAVRVVWEILVGGGRVRRSIPWMVAKVLREVHGVHTDLFSASWALCSSSSSFSNLCSS